MLRREKKHTGNPLAMVPFILQSYIFMALGIHFSREAKEKDAMVVIASLLPSMHRHDHSSLSILHQATWHIRFNQRTPLFKLLSISGRISSQLSVYSIFRARKTLAAVMLFYSFINSQCNQVWKWLGLKDIWTTLSICQGFFNETT